MYCLFLKVLFKILTNLYKDDEDQDRIVGELPAIRDYQNTVKKAQRKDGILIIWT